MEKRINIIGPSASCKTTVAHSLATELNIPVYSTDLLRFTTSTAGRKIKVGEPELLRAVQNIIAEEQWYILIQKLQ